MLSYIIMHNMIIEEADEDAISWEDTEKEPLIQPFQGPPQAFQRCL